MRCTGFASFVFCCCCCRLGVTFMPINSGWGSKPPSSGSTFLYVLGAILVVVGITLLWSMWPFRTVHAGHRGVVTMFGEVRPGILVNGLSFVNPLAHVYEINTQVQKVEMKGEAASKDLQSVHTTLAVNYHLAPELVDKLYASIGLDYEAKVLYGPGQDAFKAVASQYTAEELISKREDVRRLMLAALHDKVAHLSGGTVIVDDVFITNFNFSEAFNKSIEAKQVAEQDAQKATRDLTRIKVEAEQKVVSAQAEAQQIRIQAEAIKAQGGAEYVQMRAIAKWNGQLPTYLGAGTVPFVNIK
jgi:prohibitin 2